MNREGIKSEHLKERLKASTGYFIDKLIEIFTPVMKDCNITIGNKTVKAQYENALEAFKLSLSVKVGTFKRIGDEGFSVKGYLSAKAKASLDDLKPEKEKKEKKVKPEKEVKVKRQKGDSERETLAMFREGKTIDEIAKERSLTKSTIESHLASFIPTGEVSLDDIVPKERQIAILNAALKFSNEERSYTVVKESLPDDYSYGEIRLVFNTHLRKDEPSNPEKRKE